MTFLLPPVWPPGSRRCVGHLQMDLLRCADLARTPPVLFNAFRFAMSRSPFDGLHWYRAHAPPLHRTHLRASRRVWRIVVLATQTPLIRVLPGPQPTATCVSMSCG